MFFGHSAARPSRSSRDRPFDAARDVRPRNVVGIALADADVRTWGRRFDVAFVHEVRETTCGAALVVEFYECVGFETPPALDGRDLRQVEREQLDGTWRRKRGAPRCEVDRENVLCEVWVNNKAPGNGQIFEGHKEALLLELDRLYDWEDLERPPIEDGLGSDDEL